MATTTKYWTWAQIKSKIDDDLDLENEVFIDDAELLSIANEAIDEAEAEINSTHEDYFLTKSSLTLVSGTDSYSLPTNIYANKIRRVTYRNGANVYTLTRLKDWHKFENYEIERVTSSSTEYSYFILNTTPGSPQILLTPPANENGAYVTIWFKRQANRLESDSDVCDIPECINFVLAYMRKRVAEKEGHPNLALWTNDLEKQRQLMHEVLADMVPDADNEIEMDLSFYQEME